MRRETNPAKSTAGTREDATSTVCPGVTALGNQPHHCIELSDGDVAVCNERWMELEGANTKNPDGSESGEFVEHV